MPAGVEAPVAATPGTGASGNQQNKAQTDTTRRTSRERRSVAQFDPATYSKEPAKAKGFELQQGTGTKLSDIPNVAFKLSKSKGTDEHVEFLHRILFRVKGKPILRKKHLLHFCGIGSEEDASKLRERLSKGHVPTLNLLCDLLDISPRPAKKDDKVSALANFLKEPKQLSDKDLAAKEEKAKAKRKRAREQQGQPSNTDRRARQRSKKQTGQATGEVGNVNKEDAAQGADASDLSDQEGSIMEEASKSGGDQPVADRVKGQAGGASKGKQAVRRSSNKRARLAGKGSRAEEEAADLQPAKGTKQTTAADADFESMEGDEDVAANVSLPNGRSLQEEVLAVLEGVDVQEFNIKMLMEMLIEKHGASVEAMKPMVKAIAIQYCNSKGAPPTGGDSVRA